MKRICLVTGGSGLLGNSLREVIKSENVDFTENESEIIINSNDNKIIKKYIFLSSNVCDLTNFDDTENFLKKNEFTDIIHFAAHVGGLYANINNNLQFLVNNLEINLNVIKLCHKYSITRGIFTLSTCIFPEKCNLPLIEENMHEGRCHLSNEGYSVSKRVLEILVRFYREKYNYEWICIIPTNIYGKYDNFNLDNSHVIPSIIHKMYLAKENNTNVKLMGDGTAVRQFIYNRDVNNILYYILNTNYSKNLTIIKDNIFNIILSTNIPSNELTVKELADKIKCYLGFNNEILFDKTKDNGIHKKTSSNGKLMKILDKSFSFTDINEGLKETIDWFIREYENIRK
ncbi:GDP-L-fucose synthase [Plasmodium brasilianum]|uniref:GDP-L-fucose synthase n=2 Tax=Plasmodium (Plasmodium) TaxID=418103 RepID=A0A1D3PAE0_PLAMA|nr:GDP-L-fucose synthase, putative [Plasmodium malariae]KAI4838834.1 GDP-L-fucose synthase [Plasmodium brasilianum]SCN12175.1 GDP-L-fucose synthase, putative [Plasmodium malariae]